MTTSERELLLEFAAYAGIPAEIVEEFLAKRVEIREGIAISGHFQDEMTSSSRTTRIRGSIAKVQITRPTVMTEVTFYLPLDPTHRFTLEALKQVAELISGKPVRLADDGRRAGRDRVGTVTSAVVEGDRVLCTADVDDKIAELVGGYGLDGTVRIQKGPERIIDAVQTARVAAVRPDMLPLGAEDTQRP